MMKLVLKEHVDINTKAQDGSESEIKKMIISKQSIISGTIFPILKQLPAEKVVYISKLV